MHEILSHLAELNGLNLLKMYFTFTQQSTTNDAKPPKTETTLF